ncbi:MAG TPA: helix-turn-helix domain-containing protein [Gaiellaceae bacterium]|jgi:predicted ArsR family transcriptional regulator|nr:helix-turn-helix domain-containing protein [Gaiellaceae bacterium]
MHGERQRSAILEALGRAPDGLDVEALGEALGIHPNTVRWHVGTLVADGHVYTERQRHGRGRPRVVYHGVVPKDGYRRLAEMLTAAIDDADAAYEAGRRFGRELGREDDIAAALTREGFDATQDGDSIEMRRCPFFDVARANPRIVCGLHRGLVDGTLEAGRSPLRVIQLRPFVEPGVCQAQLGVPANGERPAPCSAAGSSRSSTSSSASSLQPTGTT